MPSAEQRARFAVVSDVSAPSSMGRRLPELTTAPSRNRGYDKFSNAASQNVPVPAMERFGQPRHRPAASRRRTARWSTVGPGDESNPPLGVDWRDFPTVMSRRLSLRRRRQWEQSNLAVQEIRIRGRTMPPGRRAPPGKARSRGSSRRASQSAMRSCFGEECFCLGQGKLHDRSSRGLDVRHTVRRRASACKTTV